MIKYDYEITVNGNQAKLNKDIYLFRGNKNVHYYFAVKNASFNFKGSTDLIEKTNAINAAVTVIKPNNVEVASAIAKVENGKIHLKVTEDLIDEEVEVGDFDLVFDLFDDTDGAVTIPKVAGQFHVLERPCTTPISELVATNTTNEVDQALTDYAIVTYAEPVASTNADGTFAKKTWVPKEKITTAELNRIEEGIFKNSSQIKDIANLKIDNITLSDNVLTFFANSKTIKTITLPTSITGGGTNGKEIELQKSTTHIQWRYVGDTDWTNLVALSDLKGDKGDTGEGVVSGGTTGQILAKKSNTDYDTEWIDAPSTGGSSEKEWITIVDETLKLTEAVSRIKKTVDTDLSSLNEISLYAEISKNTNSDTSDVIFTGINFGGMSFNYFSFAKVTSTTGINIHIKYYLKEPKPYYEKIENVARLAYNASNVIRQLSVEGSITSNNISISLDKAYMGTIKLQIYGK